jgi:hypothetical protein
MPGIRPASPGFIDSQPGMSYSCCAGTVSGAATLLQTTRPSTEGVIPVSRVGYQGLMSSCPPTLESHAELCR